MASDERYEVILENIFEGPMDLLVYLVKKNELNIYDIPIALITDQYLAYLEWMKSMNVDVAGDFILMASMLIQIKSKMLLPVPETDDEEMEDPRLAITQPLIEYLKMKSLAEQLAERALLGDAIFVREPDIEDLIPEREDQEINVSLADLIRAFRKILENLSPEHRVDLSDEKISIKDRIAEIVDIIEKKGTATFEELFARNFSKQDVIITFLAILEMAKLGLLRITQNDQTGVIRCFYM